MKLIRQFTLIALCAASTPLARAQTADNKLDRTKLPIAEPDYPRSKVELVRGQTSRHKLVKLYGISVEEVLARLGNGLGR